MSNTSKYDAMFSSIIGQDYDKLQLICPAATEMSRLVGNTVLAYPNTAEPLQTVELGGGTGVTTLALLTAKDDMKIISVDNEPTMQEQAKQRLKQWVDEGRLTFSADDALTALQQLANDSVNIIASAYTLHNFLDHYRWQVIKEIFRVLEPNGQFINGETVMAWMTSDSTPAWFRKKSASILKSSRPLSASTCWNNGSSIYLMMNQKIMSCVNRLPYSNCKMRGL